ncbi:ADP-ribosylglycohydrolase family protein [Wenzhouxiangella sp. XN24]|uniref:ADP-ribosylglycohydrolase family protein n=1 Tax=Wenzhouxiangella sp. XN24 TaxID=2713569 RepID=UPI0013EDD719|nr:ADP-ribosylglycohydrolase family protein [Wenzhouxiangella sp. XN24]NGX15985.1 ADP-ribosylglycohydrolase family protein [Wenzhouxiangella sp. XN24]
MTIYRDRFRGCLLGGATGDALGAPVENMSRAGILERFGPSGITRYAEAHGGRGRITAATQMSLFTAEGLLRAWVRGCLEGHASVPEVTLRAYLRWLHTQRETTARHSAGAAQLPAGDGWLIQQAALHSRRSPGSTCLAALEEMRPGMLDDSPDEHGPRGTHGLPPDLTAPNNSKGPCALVRNAPIGLFMWLPRVRQTPQHAFQLGVDLAALTHGHPTGQLAAGALAALVLLLADGRPPGEALAETRRLVERYPRHTETLHAIEQAEILAGSELPHARALEELGGGQAAEEVLAIAIYCVLAGKSFAEVILLAVNHDGNSQATGAVAGNLAGARYGMAAIPADWLAPLELRAVICEIADDIYNYRTWDLGADARKPELAAMVVSKYPGR